MKLKENRGITLIALVVTIVVLIILAVISIDIVIGEDGIIRQAERAREHQANAEVEDNEKLNILDEHIANTIEKEDEEVPVSLAPGLYETGSNYTVLLKDWETLKSEGLITVEGNKLSVIDYDIAGDLKISEEIEELEAFSSFYEQCGSIDIWSAPTKLTGVKIPSTISIIPDYTFVGCSGLTNVVIPESVTEIKNFAFYGCSSLKSIKIPNSVTSIGDYVFSGCSSLTGITIPDSVTSIGYYAFLGCNNLKNVTINSNEIVSSIDWSGAVGYLVSNATTIYIKADIPEASIGSYITNTDNFTKEAESDKPGYVKYTKK